MILRDVKLIPSQTAIPGNPYNVLLPFRAYIHSIIVTFFPNLAVNFVPTVNDALVISFYKLQPSFPNRSFVYLFPSWSAGLAGAGGYPPAKTPTYRIPIGVRIQDPQTTITFFWNAAVTTVPFTIEVEHEF